MLSNYIIYVDNYPGYSHCISGLFLFYVRLFRGGTLLGDSTYHIKPIIGILNFKMSEVQTEGSIVIKEEDIWKWLINEKNLYSIWKIASWQKCDHI